VVPICQSIVRDENFPMSVSDTQFQFNESHLTFISRQTDTLISDGRWRYFLRDSRFEIRDQDLDGVVRWESTNEGCVYRESLEKNWKSWTMLKC
jgi:hypothetical protein